MYTKPLVKSTVAPSCVNNSCGDFCSSVVHMTAFNVSILGHFHDQEIKKYYTPQVGSSDGHN